MNTLTAGELIHQLTLPVQLNPSPSKPSSHVQLKLPLVSVQLALELHVCISSSHSLISAQSDRLISVHGHNEDSYTTVLELYTVYIFLKTVTTYDLLEQLTPSPVYPVLQEQV